MTVNKLNPDSVILQQLDGQWQKIAMLLLLKLAGREKVRITHAEMESLTKQFAPGIPVLMTHGHFDSIDFQVIDEAAARRLADYDAQMRGTA